MIFSPAVELYLPAQEGGSAYLAPGFMVTGSFSFLDIHANVYYSANVSDTEAGNEVWLLTSPELCLGQGFSLYTEANLYYSLRNEELILEFWPGVSWCKEGLLSLTAACGVPADLAWVSPGIAAYLNF